MLILFFIIVAAAVVVADADYVEHQPAAWEGGQDISSADQSSEWLGSAPCGSSQWH